MQHKRILIACPVHNREWILPYYLKYLHALDYDKNLIDIYWIVNNTTDKSKKLLERFKEEHGGAYRSITIEVHNNKKMPKKPPGETLWEALFCWLRMNRPYRRGSPR